MKSKKLYNSAPDMIFADFPNLGIANKKAKLISFGPYKEAQTEFIKMICGECLVQSKCLTLIELGTRHYPIYKILIRKTCGLLGERIREFRISAKGNFTFRGRSYMISEKSTVGMYDWEQHKKK